MRSMIFSLFALMALAGCTSRDLPTPAAQLEVRLESASAPEALAAGRTYRFEVTLSGEADSVRLDALLTGQTQPERTWFLHDDGAALYPDDGDVVAFDHKFSQRILWQPAVGSGQNYQLRFQAYSGSRAVGALLELTRRSGDLKPPVIRTVILPDSLPSGFAGNLLFAAVVEDSSGAGDVTMVEVSGTATGKASFDTLLYDDGSHGDAVAGDGHFTLAVDRAFSARKSGAYTLTLVAVDRAGLKSAPVTAALLIRNGAPQLSDLSAPDVVSRPASGNIGYLVTISVDEPQGQEDIRRVLLRAYNPDGSGFNNNPFVMYDNGLPLDISRWDLGYRGDQVARDATWSMTIIFDPNKALGPYRLTFVAEDWVGNQSTLVTHQLNLN